MRPATIIGAELHQALLSRMEILLWFWKFSYCGRETSLKMLMFEQCAAKSQPSGQSLGAQPSVRSLAEAASAAQEGDARQVLGVAEPGESLPVPQGWRSSGMPLILSTSGTLNLICDLATYRP